MNLTCLPKPDPTHPTPRYPSATTPAGANFARTASKRRPLPTRPSPRTPAATAPAGAASHAGLRLSRARPRSPAVGRLLVPKSVGRLAAVGAGVRGLWPMRVAGLAVARVYAGMPVPRARDGGMSTAEYAVGTVAACGFAALLFKILTSSKVRSLVVNLVTRALNLAG